MTHMGISANEIAAVLGGQTTLGLDVQSTRQLDDVVREGMPKLALDTLISALMNPLYGPEYRVRLRNKIVPRATYQRVKVFNLQVGETTERLARLYALAMSAFDDKEQVTHFLMTAHPELDGRTPFESALTEIGGRQVEEVIERGLHGLPA